MKCLLFFRCYMSRGVWFKQKFVWDS